MTDTMAERGRAGRDRAHYDALIGVVVVTHGQLATNWSTRRR